MKTTLEIDDDLYREAKAVAALSGRKMKDLVAEGLRKVLRPNDRLSGNTSAQTSAERLKHCFALADELMKAAPRSLPARELLSEDRNRLEAHE